MILFNSKVYIICFVKIYELKSLKNKFIVKFVVCVIKRKNLYVCAYLSKHLYLIYLLCDNIEIDKTTMNIMKGIRTATYIDMCSFYE